MRHTILRTCVVLLGMLTFAPRIHAQAMVTSIPVEVRFDERTEVPTLVTRHIAPVQSREVCDLIAEDIPVMTYLADGTTLAGVRFVNTSGGSMDHPGKLYPGIIVLKTDSRVAPDATCHRMLP